MSRPKGSKNRKSSVGAKLSEITRKIEAVKADLTAEEGAIDEINEKTAKLKKELREKKNSQKRILKKLKALESMREAAESEAEAESVKLEAEKLVSAMLAHGRTASDILSLLGGS